MFAYACSSWSPGRGGYWEQHCEAHLRSVGFEMISEEWRSCFWHERLKLVLVVNVDDFELSGPKSNMAEGWKLISSGLTIKAPTGPGHFLGCDHTVYYITVKGKNSKLKVMEYSMEPFFDDCLKVYEHFAAQVGMPLPAGGYYVRAHPVHYLYRARFATQSCQL